MPWVGSSRISREGFVTSQRLSATDDLVAEVTRWGLEATGFDLGRAREEQQHAAVPPTLPDV